MMFAEFKMGCGFVDASWIQLLELTRTCVLELLMQMIGSCWTEFCFVSSISFSWSSILCSDEVKLYQNCQFQVKQQSCVVHAWWVLMNFLWQIVSIHRADAQKWELSVQWNGDWSCGKSSWTFFQVHLIDYESFQLNKMFNCAWLNHRCDLVPHNASQLFGWKNHHFHTFQTFWSRMHWNCADWIMKKTIESKENHDVIILPKNAFSLGFVHSRPTKQWFDSRFAFGVKGSRWSQILPREAWKMTITLLEHVRSAASNTDHWHKSGCHHCLCGMFDAVGPCLLLDCWKCQSDCDFPIKKRPIDHEALSPRFGTASSKQSDKMQQKIDDWKDTV